jgi:hypothetical protein
MRRLLGFRLVCKWWKLSQHIHMCTRMYCEGFKAKKSTVENGPITCLFPRTVPQSLCYRLLRLPIGRALEPCLVWVSRLDGGPSGVLTGAGASADCSNVMGHRHQVHLAGAAWLEHPDQHGVPAHAPRLEHADHCLCAMKPPCACSHVTGTQLL